MTDRLALYCGLVIVAAFATDALAFGGGLPLFLLEQTTRAVDWLEFWR